MGKIYAGTIIEKRDGEYGDDAESVCNLVIGTTKKAFGGIEVLVKKTVVLFQEAGAFAIAELSEGDRVFFNDVIRNPRIYTTPKGTRVETVEMIGDVFVKLTKEQLADGLADENNNMMSDDEFVFTDADRTRLEKRAEIASKNDTDLDEVFA